MATAAISLTLAGNPVTSTSGNTFSAVLVVASGYTTPSGTAKFTDSNGGTATTTTWTGPTVLASGTASFSATASITTAENGGMTVQATYSGSDYTVAASNVLTVSTNGEEATSSAVRAPYAAQTFPNSQLGSGYGTINNAGNVFQTDQNYTIRGF
jgi:hypothetical protein